MARAALRADPRLLPALQVVARDGGAEDEPMLRARAVDFDSGRRVLALEGLIHLGRLSSADAVEWLRDPDSEVVQAALRLIPSSNDPALTQAIIPLANHPDWRFAESARARLQSSL